MKKLLFKEAAAKSCPIGGIIASDEVGYTKQNFKQSETISWPLSEIWMNKKTRQIKTENNLYQRLKKGRARLEGARLCEYKRRDVGNCIVVFFAQQRSGAHLCRRYTHADHIMQMEHRRKLFGTHTYARYYGALCMCSIL